MIIVVVGGSSSTLPSRMGVPSTMSTQAMSMKSLPTDNTSHTESPRLLGR